MVDKENKNPSLKEEKGGGGAVGVLYLMNIKYRECEGG